MKRLLTVLSLASLVILPALRAAADGSVFISGHDPDFHAALGGNAAGAQHIIQQSLAFARNGASAKFLVIQSNTDNVALGDHTDSLGGLAASGFTNGVDFDVINATNFATTDLSLYSALFVPSDHGGTLTGTDLDALVARSGDILNYLNAGGGLVAFSEDGFSTPPTDAAKRFKFLPFVVSSTAVGQSETWFTVTPFGNSLGLVDSDVNGNFSHSSFSSLGGMTPVDFDAAGRIISAGFRGHFGPGGVVPEGTMTVPFAVSLVLLAGYRRRRRK